MNSVMDIVVKIVLYMCKCYESSGLGTVERNRNECNDVLSQGSLVE